jgi:DNA repair protein RadD
MISHLLRDYQLEAKTKCKEALLQNESALLVLSTGLGKSLTSFSLCEDLIAQGKRGLFIVHKVQLVRQVLKDVRKYMGDVGSFCGSLEESDRIDTPLVVGSIQTLARRLPKVKFDFIAIDEAHRYDTRKDSQYNRFLNSLDNRPPIFGMTATPFRTSGGYIYGERKLWKEVTYKKGLLWAIENKWLVRPILKHTKEQFDTSKLKTKMGDFDQKQIEALSLDVNKVKAQIADALPQLEGRKKIIWHCTCIEHAELVAKLLNELGEKTLCIHSQMEEEQDALITKFESDSDVRHLSFVMIISEGVDVPCIDAVVLMRPTKSPVTYVQCIGRGLRLFPGKETCLILDYGQVIKNCGPLDDPYIRVVGSRKLPDDPSKMMKFCPMCLEYMRKVESKCPECGHDFIAAMLREQQDRLKNLTKTSNHVGTLLSSERPKIKQKDEEIVTSIDPSLTRAALRKSAAGNNYIAINYYAEDLDKSVTQFFTFGANKYQVENNYKKLHELTGKSFRGVNLNTIVEEVNKIGFRHIRNIVLVKDRNFPDKFFYKVKRVEFHSAERSEAV